MNHWITQRENQKISTDKWKWNHNTPKPIGCRKSSSKKKFTPYKTCPQRTRKISNKQPNLTPKATKERITNKNPKLTGEKS